MFNTDDGAFAGHFYTQTPSDAMNSSIEIIGDDFYAVSCVDCVMQKFSMVQAE
ncbi:MAG: hypothetical protein KAR40_04545 [Candidatus Sabulitectum sp.]|nr:hypothetical protein [Candidatus Sabulitectum sp.]